MEIRNRRRRKKSINKLLYLKKESVATFIFGILFCFIFLYQRLTLENVAITLCIIEQVSNCIYIHPLRATSNDGYTF